MISNRELGILGIIIDNPSPIRVAYTLFANCRFQKPKPIDFFLIKIDFSPYFYKISVNCEDQSIDIILRSVIGIDNKPQPNNSSSHILKQTV